MFVDARYSLSLILNYLIVNAIQSVVTEPISRLTEGILFSTYPSVMLSPWHQQHQALAQSHRLGKP